MVRLLDRYKNVVLLTNTWILPYAWRISYLILDLPQDLRSREVEEEFFCNTNNIAFACMIFEAQKLPLKITIYKAEFKSKVDL